MPTAISPYHYDTDFSEELTLENMIDIFAARVQGWQLDPAQRLLDSDMHSGFAVLHILMSYFEMIAQFHSGAKSDGNSRKFFRKGIKLVFTLESESADDPKINSILDTIYDGVRCGLYHSGLTKAGVLISGQHPTALEFANGIIYINPYKLPLALKAHLHRYISELRNPQNQVLRNNFEKIFRDVS